MNLPLGPYDTLLTEAEDGYSSAPAHLRCVKIVARVSESDKNLLMTVIPNRGLHNLLIQHALKRTADFIRDHQLDYTQPDSATKLLAFVTQAYEPVRDDAVARPAGKTNARNGGRGAKAVRATPKNPSHVAPVLREGDSGTE